MQKIEKLKLLFRWLLRIIAFICGIVSLPSLGLLSPLFPIMQFILLLLGILLFEFSLKSKDSLNKANIRVSACYLLLFLIFISGFFLPTGHIPQPQWAVIRKEQCKNNLSRLWMALGQYALDNNGIFPPTVEGFANLYPKSELKWSKKVLCSGDKDAHYPSPSFDDITNTEIDAPNSAQISYIYTPGLSQESDPNLVILKDNSPSNHLGVGVNILHVDGSISFEPVPGKSWEREIRREWASYLLRYHLCKLIVLFLAVFVTIHRIILLINRKALQITKNLPGEKNGLS